MVDVKKFEHEINELVVSLSTAKRVLITAPGAADGDSIGAQLALRRMILQSFPESEIQIINDEPLPDRYRFLPDAIHSLTPETATKINGSNNFDVAIIVDGGIDRAGRVREIYEQAKIRVFIDHHAVSIDYPYTLRIVDPTACSTTELMFHLSQTPAFRTKVSSNFAQHIYLGLIFDTGFFRHSNTTPEAMELGAYLLKTGFDFTRVGERGMLDRSFASLKLLADTLNRSELNMHGKIIWSTLTQKTLKSFQASDDDREGIIDHLFLTHGIEVAVLFIELPDGSTKISFRSQGLINVAVFARSLTERGGGHQKAAGALLNQSVSESVRTVLEKLENELKTLQRVKC